MKRLITALLVALSTTAAFGGQARVQQTVIVNKTPDQLATWLTANMNEVARSTGSEIVSRSGDKVRVRKRTAKGTFEFTLQETVTQSTPSVYNSHLVESHRGSLRSQDTTATLSPHGSKQSKVSITMSAEAEGYMDVDVRISLNKSMRGLEDLLGSL